MIRWKKLRILLVAVIFGGVLFVLGKSILYPSAGDRTPTEFVFPATVSLPEWQFLASSSLVSVSQVIDPPEYISGKHYRYVQNNLSLDIEMRYIVGTDGDVKKLIERYKAIPPSVDRLFPLLRQQEGVGFYSLFVRKQQAYLSACINPRGGSTITSEQFRRNRNIYDVQLSRFLRWLLGEAELRDMRCLWAHLSVPLNNSSAEGAYKTLEKAWFSWYQWWRSRFPNP